MNLRSISISLIAAVIGMLPLTSSATPHCQPCPYSCGDLGLGKKECSELSQSRGLCCLDLTKKGLELAQEQERLLGSSARASSCPSGFTPSERRCSDEERRRGCRDQRVGPERMGCVSAGFR
jgi:hypothetical protein